MADNPIQDNTNAQEQQTEALQDLARGQEHLTQAAQSLEQAFDNEAKHRQELQVHQQANAGLPLPSRGVAGPEALQAKFQQEQRRQEQQKQPQPERQHVPFHERPQNAEESGRQGAEMRRNRELSQQWQEEFERHRMAPPARKQPELPPEPAPSAPRPTPTPTPAPAAPTPAPPTPTPTPAPAAPAVPLIAGAVAEMERRLAALLAAYRAGMGPESVGVRGLRGRVQEQESFLGEQYAGLSESDRKRAQPLMIEMEQRRDELLEVEAQLREKNNKQLKTNNSGLEQFARGVGAFQYAYKSFNQLASVAHRIFEEGRHGVYALRPGLGTTAKATEQLVEGAHAEVAGMTEAERARLQADQWRAQWLQFQNRQRQQRRQQQQQQRRPLEEPPPNEGFWAGAARRARNLGRATAYAGEEILSVLRGQQHPDVLLGEAKEGYERLRGEHYANLLRQQGIEPQKLKENLTIPGVQGGITTALQYQSELQVNALQREDADNALLQQQLQRLTEQNALLTEIRNNINGLENMGWGGPI